MNMQHEPRKHQGEDGFSKAGGGACKKWSIGLSISRRFAEVLHGGKLIRRPAWGERRVI